MIRYQTGIAYPPFLSADACRRRVPSQPRSGTFRSSPLRVYVSSSAALMPEPTSIRHAHVLRHPMRSSLSPGWTLAALRDVSPACLSVFSFAYPKHEVSETVPPRPVRGGRVLFLGVPPTLSSCLLIVVFTIFPPWLIRLRRLPVAAVTPHHVHTS